MEVYHIQLCSLSCAGISTLSSRRSISCFRPAPSVGVLCGAMQMSSRPIYLGQVGGARAESNPVGAEKRTLIWRSEPAPSWSDTKTKAPKDDDDDDDDDD